MIFPTATEAVALQGSGSMPRRTNSGGHGPLQAPTFAFTPST